MNTITQQSPPQQYLAIPPSPSVPLKSYLVAIGLQALAAGDHERVQLITDLLRRRRLRHV
jgi:hypothetical protein